MQLQRWHFLISYLKTLSVGPAGLELTISCMTTQLIAQSTEPPVRITWNPGNDLHLLALIRSTILETAKYFSLVWELHLMKMRDGIKLLKAKHSTKTSVSSDTIITATNFDLAACNSNLVFTSS